MDTPQEKFVWINNPLLNERKRVPESQSQEFIRQGWQQGMVDKEGLVKGIASAVQSGMKSGIDSASNIKKTVDTLHIIEGHSKDLVGRLDVLRSEIEVLEEGFGFRRRPGKEMDTPNGEENAPTTQEPGVDQPSDTPVFNALDQTGILTRLDRLISLGEETAKTKKDDEKKEETQRKKKQRENQKNEQEGKGIFSKFRIFGGGGDGQRREQSRGGGILAGFAGGLISRAALAKSSIIAGAGIGLVWLLLDSLANPKLRKFILGSVKFLEESVVPFFKDLFSNLSSFVSNVVEDIGDFMPQFERGKYVEGLMDIANSLVMNYFEFLGKTLEDFGVRFEVDFLQNLGGFIRTIPEELSSILEVGKTSVAGFFSDASDLFGNLKTIFSLDEKTTMMDRLEATREGLGETFSMISRIGASMVGLISPEAAMEFNKFLDDFTWTKLYDSMKSNIVSGIDSIQEFFKDFIGGIPSFFSEQFSRVKNFFSFDLSMEDSRIVEVVENVKSSFFSIPGRISETFLKITELVGLGVSETWGNIEKWFQNFSFDDLIWNPIKEKILGLKEEILSWVGMTKETPEDLKVEIERSRQSFEKLVEQNASVATRDAITAQQNVDTRRESVTTRDAVTSQNRQISRRNATASVQIESSLAQNIQRQSAQRFNTESMRERTQQENELRFVNEQLNLHERLLTSLPPDAPERKETIEQYKSLMEEKRKILMSMQPQNVAPSGVSSFMNRLGETRSESFIEHRMKSNQSFLDSINESQTSIENQQPSSIVPLPSNTNSHLQILEKTLETMQETETEKNQRETSVQPQRTSSIMNMPLNNFSSVSNDFNISMRTRPVNDDPILHSLKTQAFQRGLA